MVVKSSDATSNEAMISQFRFENVVCSSYHCTLIIAKTNKVRAQVVFCKYFQRHIPSFGPPNSHKREIIRNESRTPGIDCKNAKQTFIRYIILPVFVPCWLDLIFRSYSDKTVSKHTERLIPRESSCLPLLCTTSQLHLPIITQYVTAVLYFFSPELWIFCICDIMQ